MEACWNRYCMPNQCCLQVQHLSTPPSKERQARGMDTMVEATECLGLYDRELEGIPVRSKR